MFATLHKFHLVFNQLEPLFIFDHCTIINLFIKPVIMFTNNPGTDRTLEWTDIFP